MSLSDAPMCDLFRRFARRDWIDMLPHAYAPVVGDYIAPVETVTAYTTPAISVNILYATLILLQRRMRFDRIKAYQNAVGAAGALARLGIYNVSSNYYPTSLILDAGAMDCSVWTHELTINQTLDRGWYALCVVVNDATIVFRTRTGALGVISPVTYIPWSAWQVAQAYGALPVNYPAGGVPYGSRTPVLRVAELL